MKQMFKSALPALLLVATSLASQPLTATNYDTMQSGDWNSGGNWVGGVVPPTNIPGLFITIKSGHTLTIPNDLNLAFTAVVTIVVENGATLAFGNTNSRLTLPDGSLLVAINGSTLQEAPGANPNDACFKIGVTNYTNSILPFINGDGQTNGITAQSLPLELTKFEARPHLSSTEIRWATASECDVRSFEIERSADGLVFQKIGEVAASRGCSAIERSYSFTDHNPLVGSNFYRLRTVDLGGSELFSEIESVESRGAAGGISVAPSVVAELFKLETGGDTEAAFFIRDMAGRLVGSGEMEAGSSLEIDASGWHSGVYQISVHVDGEIETARLVKI